MSYPQGVTGNEPEIAGAPEREVRVEVECEGCDYVGEQVIELQLIDFGSVWSGHWVCPVDQWRNDYEEDAE